VRLEGLGQLKKSNDLIGIWTRDLPACSIAPQPTTLPRAPIIIIVIISTLIKSRRSLFHDYSTGWRSENRRSIPWRIRGFSVYLEASFETHRTFCPMNTWGPWGPDVTLSAHLYLVAMVRMLGAIYPLHHTSTYIHLLNEAQGQCFYLLLILHTCHCLYDENNLPTSRVTMTTVKGVMAVTIAHLK
jgi:hypothetical protein